MSENKPRGLGSLLASTATSGKSAPPESGVRLLEIPVDQIVPNPRQPRRKFSPESISILAESIKHQGLLQPVIVRQVAENYELIAGERRWRAVKLAGFKTIRAVCRTSDNAESLTLSIIENLQREDLDPIEEATAFKTLITELGLTQEQVAVFVGKDRTTVTNFMRLLELPLAIQAKLASGSITPGHARVLLAVGDPTLQGAMAERAADKGMSVRELERLVYGGEGRVALPSAVEWPAQVRKMEARPAYLRDLESRIGERLGARVKLTEGRRGGRLVIAFRSNADFLRILEVLGVNTNSV